MTDAIWVAMIVAVPTTVAPVLLRMTDSKARRLEKEQDYERQDLVALRVAEVSDQAARAAKLLAQNQGDLGTKLDEIHQFVNSDTTALKRANLALLEEVVALRRAAGHEPSDAVLKTIADIRLELDERDKQQAANDAP